MAKSLMPHLDACFHVNRKEMQRKSRITSIVVAQSFQFPHLSSPTNTYAYVLSPLIFYIVSISVDFLFNSFQLLFLTNSERSVRRASKRVFLGLNSIGLAVKNWEKYKNGWGGRRSFVDELADVGGGHRLHRHHRHFPLRRTPPALHRSGSCSS